LLCYAISKKQRSLAYYYSAVHKLQSDGERQPLFMGAAGVAKVQRLFEKEDLPFPPLPLELLDRFVVFAPWFFGTRLLPYSPYSGFETVVQEFEQGQAPDYVTVAHDGHGVNSYALHFFMVKAPLGIFLQLPWGGAYSNGEMDRSRIARYYAGAHHLLAAVSQARDNGGLASDAPVMFTGSFRRPNRAIWPTGATDHFDLADGEKIIEEMVADIS
jgi:hypothetical protein